MLRNRIIPCLLLKDGGLVKTVNFKNPRYIGDPINTVKIFNEKGVDELVFLDITASVRGTPPNFKVLSEIADECFMPLAYGGGVKSIEHIRKILSIGVEKIIINSYAVECPDFISEAASLFGNQSIIGSMDVKKDYIGRYRVVTRSATGKTGYEPVVWAQALEKHGAGEILVTSVDKEGTWEGYDLSLIKKITSAVKIPVIAHGGAGTANDLALACKEGGASAAAAGSMVVYLKKGMGVLINMPETANILS